MADPITTGNGYPEHYRSCSRPEDFLCDFLGFYREADRRTAALRDEGATVHWHRPYGPHPAQIADVWMPPPDALPVPVFVFLHGGGFTEGHPDHYGFLARPFIDRGVAFVSAGYRLAPEAAIEDSIADGATLLAWLHREAGTLGIDPSRCVVGGHSAGAMIWASLAPRRDWAAHHDVPDSMIRGAVLISGVYDFQERQRLRSLPPLDPTDPLLRLEPLAAMAPGCPPLVIAAGSPELNRVGWPSDLFETSARLLHRAASSCGVRADLVLLPDADHRATAEALADPRGPVFTAAARLISESGITPLPRKD